MSTDVADWVRVSDACQKLELVSLPTHFPFLQIKYLPRGGLTLDSTLAVGSTKVTHIKPMSLVTCHAWKREEQECLKQEKATEEEFAPPLPMKLSKAITTR